MIAKDNKQRRKAVWISQVNVELYQSLNLSMPLEKFVETAFYDKIDEIRSKKEVSKC